MLSASIVYKNVLCVTCIQSGWLFTMRMQNMKKEAASGPTQLCAGTREPRARCTAGLGKYLLSDGAWTSFLINKLQALQKYLRIYTVLGFPMDTGKGAGWAPQKMNEAGKGVSPSLSPP